MPDTESVGVSSQYVSLAKLTDNARYAKSPTFTLSRNNSTATRQFFLQNPGSDNQYLMQVASDLVGYSYRQSWDEDSDFSESHKLWRHLPSPMAGVKFGSQYPAFLWAKSVSVVPYGKTTTSVNYGGPFNDGIPFPQYTAWKLTVEYGIRPYNVVPWEWMKDSAGATTTKEFNRYVIEEYQPIGEALNLPRGVCYFNEGPLRGKPFPDGVAKILPRAKIKWTWVEIPKDCMPWVTIRSAIGKINRGAFRGKYHADGEELHTEGTLLLEDVEIVPTVGILGDIVFDVIYNTNVNPNKHYKVFYKTQETGENDLGFYEIVTKYGAAFTSATPGVRIYDSIVWDDLFTPV